MRMSYGCMNCRAIGIYTAQVTFTPVTGNFLPMRTSKEWTLKTGQRVFGFSLSRHRSNFLSIYPARPSLRNWTAAKGVGKQDR